MKKKNARVEIVLKTAKTLADQIKTYPEKITATHVEHIMKNIYFSILSAFKAVVHMKLIWLYAMISMEMK